MTSQHFARLSPRARWGFALGAATIVLALAAAGTWLLRTDYQVLFADLRQQDAAQMVAELDRQKIPYRMGEDGISILVDAAVVHTTRMKLLGKELPLGGAAGFELFNSGDFGMTEFAQKINYQRALQGEITRTILSLAEVREARVHLALPEEGLFKRATSKPKASITLGLKAGQALRPEQVSGIQRLVAGAVPGISAGDVTIVDTRGVALTRAAGTEADGEGAAGARLDLKRDVERLLARKATDVLERAFGPGQAMATVDATIDMDQVKVTTEDVIGAPGRPGAQPTGVIVRERDVQRDAVPPLAADGIRGGNSQREVDYQVGRRVEQVTTQPGAVRRLHVAAVVRQPLDPEQLERARALLMAAVGGVLERGDTIVVQSLQAFGTAGAPGPAVAATTAASAPELALVAASRLAAPDAAASAARQTDAPVAIALVLVLVLTAILVAVLRQPGRRGASATPALTDDERARLAIQLKDWLQESAPTGNTGAEQVRPGVRT